MKVSKLHFVMHAINNEIIPSCIPGNKRYHFCSRAKALLARWEPILLQDVHHYRWLNTDSTALTYVPTSKRSGTSLFFTLISSTFQIVQI